MTARKDVHRPAEIVPAAYRYLFSFSYPGAEAYSAWNTALLSAVRTGEPQRVPFYGVDHSTGAVVVTGYGTVESPWGKLPFFEKTTGSQAGCDVCGAHYRHGDAFLHEPTGEVILIGHICGSKMNLHADHGDWTANQRRLAQLRKSAEYVRARLEREAKQKAEAVDFLRANAGLEAALETDHGVSRDLKAKLWRYGSLSPKQVELAMRLAREATEPKPDAPPEIQPPAGRVEVEGVLLSTKWVDNDFGGTEKVLVQVGNGGGVYRLWGTVPAGLVFTEDGRTRQLSKGLRIRFKATVQPKERGFGFFSRPTGGEVVQEVAS